MRFLFRLDLSLHASAEKKIWNFEFGNQTRPYSLTTELQLFGFQMRGLGVKAPSTEG